MPDPDLHPLPGVPDLAVRLRRSAQARRYTLRVPAAGGAAVLTLPARAPAAEALAFAASRADWLRDALARCEGEVPRIGGTLPFEGEAREIVAAAVRAPRLEGARLLVPADPSRLGARLAAFLRLAARERLAAAAGRHAAALGRPHGAIVLRDTRSRWGSCAADGRLMFSWRLVMAPPAVLDYVAAHEVAHLARMDHSPAFWAVVARLLPEHAAARDWLRRNGRALQAIRFGAGVGLERGVGPERGAGLEQGTGRARRAGAED